nr:type III secretion protein PcrV [Pseudomonas plecoglossicida NB2011]
MSPDAVARLLKSLHENKVELVLDGHRLTAKQAEKIFVALLSDGGSEGGSPDENVQAIRKAIQGQAGKALEVGELFMHLPSQRLDVMIIAGFTEILQGQAAKKNSQSDELKSLSVELKIYSVIQSQVSAALAKKEAFDISASGVNLMDYKLYGYTSAEQWAGSKERVFLEKLDTHSREGMSIREFLEGGPKETGKLSNLQNSYAYEKDNNPLQNFSTTLADRSRPLGDSVNEKSAQLNETNARYNAVIDAFSRMVDKFDKLLKTALG